VTIRLPRRALVIAAVFVAVLAAALAAMAQTPDKIARIGFLAASGLERERPWLAEFQRSLRELGYRERANVLIEERYADGRFERLPALATVLLKWKADILVVTGAPAALAAKGATRTVPIVMTNSADPVGIGIVASLARPGGNVTGLSDFNDGVVAKRLSLLKEVIPSLTRVAVLYNPSNPTNPIQLKLTQDAARTLGITVLPLPARTADDVDRGFATIQKERPGGLHAIGDPALGSLRKKILDLAIKQRIPASFSGKERLEDGGLLSYGPRFEDLYRRAAVYVDKILKGAKPADLPIEQPSTFELVVNLRTARALGITVPPSLVLRADHVIE
jgi:putative ABC transport system substrate-binding protein